MRQTSSIINERMFDEWWKTVLSAFVFNDTKRTLTNGLNKHSVRKYLSYIHTFVCLFTFYHINLMKGIGLENSCIEKRTKLLDYVIYSFSAGHTFEKITQSFEIYRKKIPVCVFIYCITYSLSNCSCKYRSKEQLDRER